MKRVMLMVVGLGLLLGGQARAGNLIVNGGFETGDFSGWTLLPDPIVHDEWTLVTSANYGITPYEGTYFATFSNYAYEGASGFDQTVATVPGQNYVLSFWYTTSPDASANNQFTVTWDSTTLVNMTDFASLNGIWENFTFTVTGTGSDTVTFSGFENSYADGLDDVTLNPRSIPEPSSLVVAMTALPMCIVGYRWAQRRRQSLRRS